MFHTYESWSKSNSSELFQGLVGQPGLRQFVFVEMPLNYFIFHVDIAPSNNDGRWRRFLFSKFRDILEFSEHENVPITVISLQSQRKNNETYEINKLKEVYEVITTTGAVKNIFLFSDGTENLEEIRHSHEDDLLETTCIWAAPKSEG